MFDTPILLVRRDGSLDLINDPSDPQPRAVSGEMPLVPHSSAAEQRRGDSSSAAEQRRGDSSSAAEQRRGNSSQPFGAVWAPTGDRIAWTEQGSTDDLDPANLIVADVTTPEKPLLTRLPITFAAFYLNWSRNGQRLAALSNGPLGLELAIVETDPASSAEALRIGTRGAPLFWDWNDRHEPVAHVGQPGEDRIEIIGEPDSHELAERPGAFSAPAHDGMGNMLAAIHNDVDGTELVAIGPDGDIVERLARGEGLLRFSVSPSSGRVAVIAQSEPGVPGIEARASQLAPLPASRPVIIDRQSGERTEIGIGPPVSMQWNPAGPELLLLRVEHIGDAPWLRWWLWSNEELEPLDYFRPTEDDARHLPFAEQYERSHGRFLRDGSGITWAGALTDGRTGAFIRRFKDDEPQLIDEDAVSVLPAP